MLGDAARVDDRRAVVELEHGDLDVAAGELRELLAIAVGHVDELEGDLRELERGLDEAGVTTVVEAV